MILILKYEISFYAFLSTCLIRWHLLLYFSYNLRCYFSCFWIGKVIEIISIENKYYLLWKNKKVFILLNTEKKYFVHHKCRLARRPMGQPARHGRPESEPEIKLRNGPIRFALCGPKYVGLIRFVIPNYDLRMSLWVSNISRIKSSHLIYFSIQFNHIFLNRKI